jgi:hypothetical protein
MWHKDFSDMGPPLMCGDITIVGEGLQNFGICLALMTFEQGGIFIVPHLL